MSGPLKILVLNQIAAAGLARLPQEKYELGDHIAEPDAILLRSADLHARPLPASIKAVGRAGAGTDNIPVAALALHGVPVVKAADFITLHVPLNNATRELVNAGNLQHARRGLVVLNFSRDGVVDEAAVLGALESGRMRYYVCDFPSPTLHGRHGVVALPHLGA